MAYELQWPFSLAPNGRERVVTQGSLAEVQQGVDVTFHVPAGHLRHAQSFGRPELQFSTDPEAEIRQTIKTECERVAAYELPIQDGRFTIEVTAVVDPDIDDEVTL